MKTMNRILSVMLAILLTLGMAPTSAHAAYTPGELTEERVIWEKLHFYYDGNGHCPVVTVLGIDDVVLTENEDYVLECGYYYDDGTTTEFVPLMEYPVEIGVYVCRLNAIGDYFNNEEIASEFEIEECPWGEPVKNGGVINYVDANGTTSAEVSKPNADANGLIWLKEESGGASTWYGMDNSDGAFEEGSRFWVRWLREEEGPQAFAAYYAQLDDEHKNNIKDGHLRIFLIGVTNPSGNEYHKLNQPVDCVFVDNWAGNSLEAVFISEQSDEAIETQPALSHFVPLDDGDEIPLNELLVSFPISHFSPYAVYEKKNDSQAKTGESVWWSYDDSTDTLTISDSPAEGRQEFTVEAQQRADVYNMPWNIPDKGYSKMKTVIIDGNPRPGYMNVWFCNAHDLTEIRNLRQLDTSCVTSMADLFNSCTELTQIDLSGFQTANVTNFSGMFVSCDKLSALDLSSFDTTAATDLSGMFYSCDALTDLDISGFSIQNNINCTEMFMLCESLKTLKLFSVKSGCSMTVYRMFSGCSALETIYAPCTSVWPDRETGSHVFLNCDKLSGGKGSAFSTYGGYRGGMLRFDGGEDAPGYLTAMHDWKSHGMRKAFCTSEGYADYQCQRCLDTKRETIPINPDNHGYVVRFAGQNATCTEEGTRDYYRCNWCKKKYLDKACSEEFFNDADLIIPATGHAYVNHAAQAPTCTAVGWNAYQTCANCDYTSYSEISATGHAYVDHAAQAPSCTAIGWNAYQTCANCDYTSYSEISATGHAYVNHAAQAPTCTAIGWNAYQTCANCDYTTYSEIPANGHTDGVVVIENKIDATCESSGSYDEVVYCADCGTELSRENVTVPATGHEDADNDGKCDHGGEQMTGDDHCRLCGKIHDKHTIRGVVTGWFHTLIYYAKTYVDPVLAILWVSFLTMLFP